MRAILADVNCEGHVRRLVHLLGTGWRREIWDHAGRPIKFFADVGLTANSPDSVIWNTCQHGGLVLVTINRNEESADSLQAMINAQNNPSSLPILTLADADRVLNDQAYAERTADKLLTYFWDIDDYLGTGRLFIP